MRTVILMLVMLFLAVGCAVDDVEREVPSSADPAQAAAFLEYLSGEAGAARAGCWCSGTAQCCYWAPCYDCYECVEGTGNGCYGRP